ncbi:MAG: hypothetical protein AAF149_13685 [Bacteroidota bacterium]
MSTKYYALPKVNEKERSEMIQSIQQDKIFQLKNILSKEVIIGVGRVGAQFTFYHHDWRYFEKSVESLKAFLQNSYIRDEYENELTFEAFWKKVDQFKNGNIYGDEVFSGLVFSNDSP